MKNTVRKLVTDSFLMFGSQLKKFLIEESYAFYCFQINSGRINFCDFVGFLFPIAGLILLFGSNGFLWKAEQRKLKAA
jgi:hypothetical protein